MRRALVVVFLLAGCAPKDVIQPQPQTTNTTVYRYSSSPKMCTPQPVSDSAELRRVTKSRDEWKRYAESLELLLPAEKSHVTHP